MFIIPSIFIIIEIHLVFYKEQYLCSSLYLSQYNFFNFDDINCCQSIISLCIDHARKFAKIFRINSADVGNTIVKSMFPGLIFNFSFHYYLLSAAFTSSIIVTPQIFFLLFLLLFCVFNIITGSFMITA